MNPTVTLTLVKEDEVAGEFAFTDHRRCVVGRSLDCDIQIPADTLFQDVSRHHCEFEIDPPVVRLRDLGSLNGTEVNGVRIGQRDRLKWPAEDCTIGASAAVELNPGDEVKLGQHAKLRLSVSSAPDQSIRWRGEGDTEDLGEESRPARRG
jgi:pSer/pThr/pTyr-binding forkhead associated (FHA) protein